MASKTPEENQKGFKLCEEKKMTTEMEQVVLKSDHWNFSY